MTISKQLKTVIKILQDDRTHFSGIQHKIESLRRMQEMLNPLLDPLIAPHCKIINYRQGCLIIQTTNSACATQLRYQIPMLLKMLRKETCLPGIANIHIRVRPNQDLAQKIAKPKLKLSPQAAITLKKAASSITDKPLAEALLKLSRNDE